MMLGIVALVLMVIWSVLILPDCSPRIRVIPYLLSHAAVYASVFVYGIDNHRYWYAVGVMVITVATVLWCAVRDKSYHPATVWCGVSTLILGLYVLLFYYLLPSAVSIVDLVR